MIRPVALLGVATVLCACGEAPRTRDRNGVFVRGIVGGTLDTGDPAVVALADSDGYTYCTGTIVDNRHVVTAGHCLFGERGQVYVPDYLFICVDATTASPSTDPDCYLPASSATPHPNFDLDDWDLPNDIGVVTLTNPTTIAPMPLPSGILPASAVGTDVRNVGYGINDAVHNSGDGIRRHGLSRITYIGPRVRGTTSPNPDGLVQGTFQMNESPAGTCFGDSGGPAFWPTGLGQREEFVGITSWGDDWCRSFGVDTMVGSFLCWLASAGVTTAICPADGGPPADAGQPVDAGQPEDAGQPVDAGPRPDAGPQPDGGTPSDSGPQPDAGSQSDAGVPPTPDSGTPTPIDAGAADAGVGTPPPFCGCSASGAHTMLAGLLAPLGLRRRRQ